MANILEFTQTEDCSCLICGDKKPGHLQKIKIKRPNQKDNVVAFTICDECIAKMANEMVEYVN